jgi:hypothetical protein
MERGARVAHDTAVATRLRGDTIEQ